MSQRMKFFNRFFEQTKNARERIIEKFDPMVEFLFIVFVVFGALLLMFPLWALYGLARAFESATKKRGDKSNG